MPATAVERIVTQPGREAKTLGRLLPRLEQRFAARTDPAEWEAYTNRIRQHFPAMFRRLFALYVAAMQELVMEPYQFMILARPR